MGFGLETNSHVVGYFQETVLSYEIITSDAEVKIVTKESDPELFYALPWSFGTIGILASAKLRIVRIKPYVNMKYIPTYNMKDL